MTRPRPHPLALLALALYAILVLTPIAWMILTSFKSPADLSAHPPGILPAFNAPTDTPPYRFHFTFDNYLDQFRSREFPRYLFNSLLIACVSTFASVFLGAFAAYGFSRFRVQGASDWLFFILSTRMLPAMAVAVPISWMYAKLGLDDTHFGLILLYTCFNLSFSTWMMKAFIDEIPTAYEEAALLDGYSRTQVLFAIILPEAATGLLATAVFCLIASWNEYAFAATLAPLNAQTLPVHIAAVAADPVAPPYGRLAAGGILFMTPIVLFTILMRKHLLRGITFGAVKG